jgi:hypothetical protein
VRVFDDAEPDDGLFDLAVITADGVAQWARTVGRTITGTPDRSPYFRSTKAHRIRVKLDRKVRYEMDGGARTKAKDYTLDGRTGCGHRVRAGSSQWRRTHVSSIDAKARTTGRQVTHSTTFEVLTRLGFVARGAVYATIGLLAIQVAMHATRQSTDQRGAMETIQNQPFGHWLLIAVAIGLGAYACWRFVQAFVGYGPEGGGDHSTFGRVAACRQRRRLLGPVPAGRVDPAGLVEPELEQSPQAGCWSAGVAGRAADRRSGWCAPDRDRPLPGL